MTELEMNAHMGSIHGKIISSSGSWNDNSSSSSSLCAVHDKIDIDCDIYSDVCDSISQSKRRTRESHEGNACKETQPILQEGGILGLF